MFEHVLVVCVGNICRSPTGERLLQSLLPLKTVSSAGINALVGEPANKTANLVASQHGLNLNGHKARQLNRQLCQAADLILVMEKSHKDAVAKIDASASGKTMLFGHWLEQKEIPDPYRLSTDVFEYVYKLLDESAQTWAAKLN